MKKLLLSLATLTAAVGASAEYYSAGDQILKEDLSNMSGEYNVLIKAYSKTQPGFLHPLVAGENTHFAAKNVNMTESSTFAAEYVYTINVDSDGNFTIKNSVGGYAPIPTTTASTEYFYSNTTDESGAVKFRALNCITTANFTHYYMLQTTSTGTTNSSHLEMHLDGPNHTSSYYSTAEAGQADAGGMAGNGNTSRTAAAILMFHAEPIADGEAAFEAGIAELKATAEAFGAMKEVVGEDVPTFTYDSSVETGAQIETANAAYQAYINKFNNKLVYISNKRRANTPGQTQWLSLYKNDAGNYVYNTLAEHNYYSVWQIEVSSNKLIFHNLVSGKKLHDSQLLIPAVLNDGVSLHPDGDTRYMNMNYTGGNLEWWGGSSTESAATSLGSVWYVTPATYTFEVPEISTADAPKYYRILSDRWMSDRSHNSNQLAINGENRDATGAGEDVSRAVDGHMGEYWRLEAGEITGTVKIFNLIDGYAMGGTNRGSLKTFEAENARDFYLHNLNEATMANGNSFTVTNAFGIGNETMGTGDSHTCIDASGTGAKVAEWTPTSQENKNCFEDNGSIWYFVLATDAEVAAAEQAYVAAMNTRLLGTTIDATDNLTALAGKEGAKPYTDLFKDFDRHSVDGVNAAKRNGTVMPTADEVKTAVMSILDNHVAGKQHVQLINNNYYLIDNGSKLATSTNGGDANTLWTITKGEYGYTLTNESTRKVVNLHSSTANEFPTAEDGAYEYVMTYYPTTGGFSFTRQGATLGDQTASIHRDGSNNIVKWGANATSSQWLISALDDVNAEIILESESENAYFVVIKDGGYVCPNGIAHNMEVVITPVVESRAITEPIRLDASSFSTDRAAVTLEPGNYSMTIPGGMIKTADGKHTRATTMTFAINSDGTVTSILDINADTNAPKVYYDLQGRRVANPSHGIYICNGRKIYLR